MTTQSIERQPNAQIETKAWAQIGLAAAALSIVAVLIVQVLAVAIWPEVALFRPLSSYPRSALFVLVPALGAAAVFAWLVDRTRQPVSRFVTISAVVLLASFIPDYALPDPNKTLLASTVAAFLHVVAGVITVSSLIAGYRWLANRK